MSEPAPLRLSRRKQLLFALIAVLGFFAILELLFRVGAFAVTGNAYALYHGFRRPLDTTSARFDGYFKFPPNQTLRQGVYSHPIPTRINSLGFRGDDFEAAKPPGIVRILTAGGSSTFGYYAADGRTYPALLQELLDEAQPGRFEVVNVGLPHYNTDNILALLRGEGIDYSPDLVTIYTGYNDTVQSKVHKRNPVLRSLRTLPQHSYVFHTAWKEFKKLTRGNALPASVRERFKLSSKQVEDISERLARRFRENLEAVLALGRDHGFRLLLVRQPMTTRYLAESQIETPLPYRDEVARVRGMLVERGSVYRDEAAILMHARFMDELEALAGANDLPLVDGSAHVDEHPDHLVSYVHLSEEGNAALAAALRDAILPLFPPSPESVGARLDRAGNRQ